MIKDKKPKIKQFSKNKIQKRIYAVAVERDVDPEDLKACVMEQLDISPKQLTFFLNNDGNPPSLKQMCILAQMLDCKIDDLVELK